jgi:hypothetical protein
LEGFKGLDMHSHGGICCKWGTQENRIGVTWLHLALIEQSPRSDGTLSFIPYYLLACLVLIFWKERVGGEHMDGINTYSVILWVVLMMQLM